MFQVLFTYLNCITFCFLKKLYSVYCSYLISNNVSSQNGTIGHGRFGTEKTPKINLETKEKKNISLQGCLTLAACVDFECCATTENPLRSIYYYTLLYKIETAKHEFFVLYICQAERTHMSVMMKLKPHIILIIIMHYNMSKYNSLNNRY